jgi:hypothetical protein
VGSSVLLGAASSGIGHQQGGGRAGRRMARG